MIRQPGRLVISSMVVGLTTLALMLATEPRLAIVWDEGYTLGREARLREWFRALRDPSGFASGWAPPTVELVQQVGATPPRPDQIDTRAKLLFNPEVLAYFWPFARAEPHGHPPFYALLGLFGDLLAPTWKDLPRARLGPILLFSCTAGFLFQFSARRWGVGPALVAVAAWTFQPNLFGHGHFATYDAVLTSLWVLAILAFARAEAVPEPGRRDTIGRLATVAFGLVVGCALATKLTGWFLPLPFLVWAGWTRDRRGLRVQMIGLPLACAVLFLLNPPWWTEPITGIVRFFQSNLTRGRTIPIAVQFLGIVYQTPNQSLPWYNTLVWTVLVTPVGLLLLGLAGMIRSIRQHRAEPLGLLILGNWGLLVALRALPHTPGHDGVRLFLPAFGVMGLLVGMGARQVLDWLGPWARIAVAAAVLEAIGSVLLLLPVPLSYYSPLVGGLPGATRLGMEPTYYWDGLSSEARQWLRDNTLPGQTIHFASFPTSWLYLRQTGELPRRLDPIDRGQPAWYVMQNRPGAWSRIDRQLAERSTPALVVSKFGVPLIWVFPYAAYADVEKELLKPALKDSGNAVGRESRVTHVRPAFLNACCHDHVWSEHVIIKEGRSERTDSVLSRNLGGGVNGGCRIVDRSRVSDRLTRNDRLGANGLLVAAKLESLEASEQTAMLLGSAGGLANRGRRGTRRRYNNRAGGLANRGRSGAGRSHSAGGWCTGTLPLVASLSIASQNQRPDQSAQDQSQ